MPSNQSPNPPPGVRKLHSMGSPTKALDLSWLPDGMDRNAACRLAIRIPNYEMHGTQLCRRTYEKIWVLDRDKISWMDLYADLDVEIKRGSNQSLSVSFWNKVACEYSEIDSDSSLLAAINMYWDIRKLPLIVSVINQPSHVSTVPTDLAVVDMKSSQLLICTTEIKSSLEPGCTDLVNGCTDLVTNVTNEPESNTSDPWGENDEIEYVGVDDEPLEPASNTGCDYIPDTDEEDNDDCAIDDEKGCEVVEHITDLENLKIAIGVTFEDRDTFMRAIRQYAILNEIEIAAPYNEAKTYRGFCKGKKCKWRIHASRLQDGKTWMIKKMPNKHYCRSGTRSSHAGLICVVVCGSKLGAIFWHATLM
ncbi:unnamed protein product [Urochloa decumbens]|uniref:Transposase MuDR plant domain-containing protein n=1 Tax=Urochloa decumbens TaxID=240449 RepID=A0ABC9AC83_9POAL